MKKFSRMKTLGPLVFCLALVVGCGGSEDHSKPAGKAEPAPAAEAPAALDAKAAQKMETLERTWVWPAGSGQERDLLTDHEACTESNSGIKGIKGAQVYGRCMQSKGWALRSQ